jgi:hypothetical protein
MRPPIRLGLLFCVLQILFVFTLSYADITGSLNFGASNFDTSTVLGRDSVFYTQVSCDLSNKTVADSISAPNLPTLTYIYSLPQGYEVSGITINYQTTQLLSNITHLVYPAQTPMITRIGEPEPPFVAPGSAYSQSSYPYDSLIVTCSDPLSFSFGMGMAAIQVRPIQYSISQNKLWLYTSLTFTIHTVATIRTPLVAERRSTFAQKYVSDYLKGIVKNSSSVDANLPLPVISNYNHPINPPNIPPDLIVITSTTQINNVAISAFVSWKNSKGLATKSFTLENDIYPNYSGVDNAEKLRNFIIHEATVDGVLFVLLVGNMDYVPVRFVSGDIYADKYITDLYYAGLDGNWNADADGIWGEINDGADYAADVYVGRVAANVDPNDIINWYDKEYYYVDNPGDGAGDNYLANVMIGSSDQMAFGTQPQYIADAFSDFFTIDTETYRERDNPPFPYGQDIIDYLSNPSCGYYINLNHGSPHDYAVWTTGINDLDAPRSVVTSFDGAQGGPMENGYIGDVQNARREYIHSSTSCDVGALDANYWIPYAYPDCFAEKSLCLNGGCVAGTFNSRIGWVYQSYYLEEYRVDKLCGEYHQHMFGLAHYATMSNYANSLRSLVKSNNYFGDPSLRIWTDDPQPLLVEHPIVAYRDIVQNLTITVKDNQTQIGLSNVLVTLVKGAEVYGRGFTDVTGHVTIPIRPDTEGMLKIVADRANFKAYEDSIFVDSYCEPAVAGDANGSGSCTGLDVVFLQSYFKGQGPHPPDSCMCGDNFLYHAADANGSCALTGLDLTYLVRYFKGGPAPFFCPTCPISRFLDNDGTPLAEPSKKEQSQ